LKRIIIDKILSNKILVKNYFFVSILNVLALFLPLITYPYIISKLGDELYGYIVFSFTVITYIETYVRPKQQENNPQTENTENTQNNTENTNQTNQQTNNENTANQNSNTNTNATQNTTNPTNNNQNVQQ